MPCTRIGVAASPAVLAAHAAPGGVVTYEGAGSPIDTGMPPGDFAGSLSGRRVRVLAARENVALILRLHDQSGVELEIGRPAEVDWRRHADVYETLVIQQKMHTLAGLGGWRRTTAADRPSYALADRLASRKGLPVDDESIRILTAHPAYPALAFVDHLDKGAACRLVATILDPRWWIDLRAPDATKRLRCHLGLIAAKGGAAARRAMVRDCWITPAADPAAPGGFLRRHRASLLAAHDEATADLRTSRRFLAYLTTAWTDAVVPRRSSSDRLFLPEHFFADPREAAAWRRRVEGRDRVA
jgi:hypothetical protein